MKKIIILSAIFSILSFAKASAQFQGTFGMGTHAVYGMDRNNVGAGFHIHYYWTNNLRLAPSATFFLRQNNVETWKAEIDFHFVSPLSFSTLVYPIAGVSYTNRRQPSAEDIPAASWWRLGGNFGVGLQHDIVYRLRANFEVKYHFIRDYSQVTFMIGIGFWI